MKIRRERKTNLEPKFQGFDLNFAEASFEYSKFLLN